jgi:hypothetical protein
MRVISIFIFVIIVITLAGCGSIEKLAKHEFGDGYYKLKTPETAPVNIYAKVNNDSVYVYPVTGSGKEKTPETSKLKVVNINEIKPGGYLYRSTFMKTSIDADLTTVLLKFRPSQANVPPQLSANLNAAIYLGYKKDYYKINTSISAIKEVGNSIHHFSFDAGIYAGIGITPINPTVTNDKVMLEYDGMVFQKGVAAFIGIDIFNFGIGLGFDNLLDSNKKDWIYNQKPWIGLLLGIANF